MRAGARALWGAGCGASLTATLVALSFVVAALTQADPLPFLTFDVLVRVLPGELVTWGIDALVKSLAMAGLDDLSGAAKTVERGLAIGLFLAAGTALGALFALEPWPRPLPAAGAGLTLGLCLAALVTAAVAALVPYAASLTQLSWTVVGLAGWGLSLGYCVARATVAAPAADPRARRFVVRLAGTTVALTVTGAVVAKLSSSRGPRRQVRWSDTEELPNIRALVKAVPGTRPELTPLESHYRIDINSTAPKLDLATWRLEVRGRVERPRTLALSELQRHPPLHQLVTLSCISNPVGGELIGTTRWSGTSLKHVLPQLGLQPSATHLRLVSADGFHEVVELELVRADERVMLCWEWDGVPLTAEHGFPLRIYIPHRYGMKQPKWLVALEALDRWEAGYWVERGWDRDALMKATAVIDVVDVEHAEPLSGGVYRVPVGGIAHAGARGVSRVELALDGGDWVPARLRTPLSSTSWVLWRADVGLSAGEHQLTVRCYDGTGVLQVEERTPPHPAGASGWHKVETALSGSTRRAAR